MQRMMTEGDGADSTELIDNHEEHNEPFYWTLFRATLVGLVYASCILTFACCLLIVEQSNEEEVCTARKNVRKDLQRELQFLLRNSSVPFQEESGLPDVTDFMNAFTDLCKRSNQVPPISWSLKTGALLATSVLTTTGYGHVHPTYDSSWMFCIAYGVIGIPLTLLFMHKIGLLFVEAYQSLPALPHKQTKMAACFVISILGALWFVLVLAVILMYAEDWSFYDATYYSFMCLTTIGLGNKMAGLQPLPKATDNPYLQSTIEALYQTFLISWMFLGIAYLTLLAKFVPVFEQQLCTKLREKIAQKMKRKKLQEEN